jgi:uncharacterized protein
MTTYYDAAARRDAAKGGRSHGYNSPLDSASGAAPGRAWRTTRSTASSIYFHDGDDTLLVNLFIASELRIPKTGITVRQETRFPEEDTTRLHLTCDAPCEGVLKIRHPAWAVSGVTVTVNGVPQDVASKPGSYITLRRQWNNGDRVEVKLPFNIHTEGFRDNPDRFAFLSGPLVLCGEVDRAKPFPAVVASRDDAVDSLQPVDQRPHVFTSRPGVFRIAGSTAPVSVTLEPFYQMHGERPYVVYWDRFTEDDWKGQEEAYRQEQARQAQFAKLTVDAVNPGEQQSETDHKLQGERTSAGDFNGRKWRHAVEGWFSYELKVLPDQPQQLWVTYWGSDGGARTFDVLVDGERLVTQRLNRNRPDTFFEEITPLPGAMTQEQAERDDPLPGSSRQLGRRRLRSANHAAAERGEPAVRTGK